MGTLHVHKFSVSHINVIIPPSSLVITIINRKLLGAKNLLKPVIPIYVYISIPIITKSPKAEFSFLAFVLRCGVRCLASHSPLNPDQVILRGGIELFLIFFDPIHPPLLWAFHMVVIHRGLSAVLSSQLIPHCCGLHGHTSYLPGFVFPNTSVAAFGQ